MKKVIIFLFACFTASYLFADVSVSLPNLLGGRISPDKETTYTTDDHICSYKVISTAKDGGLYMPYSTYNDGGCRLTEPFYVYTQEEIYDGQNLNVNLLFVGYYEYISTIGAKKKVLAFKTTPRKKAELVYNYSCNVEKDGQLFQEHRTSKTPGAKCNYTSCLYDCGIKKEKKEVEGKKIKVESPDIRRLPPGLPDYGGNECGIRTPCNACTDKIYVGKLFNKKICNLLGIVE